MGLGPAMKAMGTVFINPQSILCGLIAGLIFIPTTIFDMVWGVRFLQEAHDVPYSVAVLRSAAVPFGWIIGCPLLGWLTDRIGRRKPVIIGAASVLLGALALILFGPRDVFPPYSLGLARRHRIGRGDDPVHGHQGSEPAGAQRHGDRRHQLPEFLADRAARARLRQPAHGRERGRRARARALPGRPSMPLLYGVALAILLTLLLRETGPKSRKTVEAAPLGAGLAGRMNSNGGRDVD